MTERQTAEFICEVSDEKAEVTWLRDGKPIEASDKFLIVKRGKERRLSVVNTDTPDEAEYSCVIGERTTKAELLVDGEYNALLVEVSSGISSYVCPREQSNTIILLAVLGQQY